jgi:hypothetical protein
MFKLSAIVDNSETLVQKLSPAVQAAIDRQTTDIKVDLCGVRFTLVSFAAVLSVGPKFPPL